MSSFTSRLETWLKSEGVKEPRLVAPPKSDWGDLSTAFPLQLAKTVKRAPLEIAHDWQTKLGKKAPLFINRIEVTPPGYLNFFFDEKTLAKAVLQSEPTMKTLRTKGKIVLEHTSVNPNKAAHIGHVRNAVLGDTIGRILKASGNKVEIHNYIDDTGLQVADVLFAREFFQETPPQGVKIDDWAWDIYSRAQPALEENEGLKHQRNEILHLIEQRDPKWAKQADQFSFAILKRQLETMARMDIGYDALVFESSIFDSGLFKNTMGALKRKKVIRLETEGPNAGAWIIPFGGTMKLKSGEERSADKILIKSNGQATYLAKDIAYQLGSPKFNKIRTPIRYLRLKRLGLSGEMWSSRHGEVLAPVGNADQTITLTDQRQSYLQDVLRESLRQLGYPKIADQAIHFTYGVVSLSPKAAEELGVSIDENQRSVTMSGRKGIGIKANDLLNRVETVISSRGTKPKVSKLLARAAVRYAMLKVSPLTEIIFDFEASTRNTGDSGVYLCYAFSRASSLLRQARQRKTALRSYPDTLATSERSLIKTLDRFSDVIEEATLTLNPTAVAQYAFELATAFTSFYEDPAIGSIRREQNLKIKRFRLALVRAFQMRMYEVLNLLGIEPPEKM